jgi:hypothetical protein
MLAYACNESQAARRSRASAGVAANNPPWEVVRSLYLLAPVAHGLTGSLGQNTYAEPRKKAGGEH